MSTPDCRAVQVHGREADPERLGDGDKETKEAGGHNTVGTRQEAPAPSDQFNLSSVLGGRLGWVGGGRGVGLWVRVLLFSVLR